MKETREMRAVYCQTLMELAKGNKDIVIVEADLMKASGTMPFKQAYPERGIEVGVAEANLVGVAAGLSAMGKIPFAATFGCFASRRAFDQFFISANYAQLNVKLIGTDPGITAAFNGGTHMPFEDIGLMRMIPGLTIVEPSDPVSVEAMTRLLAAHEGSSYMRLHRKEVQEIYEKDRKFELGKANVLREGKDAAILALGAVMVPEALKASELLASEGISAAVIDVLTVKPLDKALVLSYAAKTGHIITAENHQVAGGLGAEVACLLSTERPGTKLTMVGIHDEFGQVGTQEWLQEHYKLTAAQIALQAKEILK